MDIFRDSLGTAALAMRDIIDNVGIAATSSQTRRHIDFCTLKSFSENWSSFFARAQELTPRQYTRLGPAIRHCTGLLESQECEKPMLVILTDGKPTDLDPYEGSHGQEDVRMAVHEALSRGIKVMALTISDLNPAALQRMFGRAEAIQSPDDFCRNFVHFIKSEGGF
jgi:nitric oxide reductase NorD protein